jgi:glycosyltransferase involved in cell wall biosynthesis
MGRIGVVVIGRNEGERLRECLLSLAGTNAEVVYVDSGSTDGSSRLARELGADLVALDMSRPFTAARARNAGFARLDELVPDLEFVQFVDGDCQVADGWIESASAEMKREITNAAVCGRRRERYPQRSVYNLLCDLEWNTPIGEAEECGGDALIRVTAFREVGGYDAKVIAGEDSEMCMRLRRRGWRIRRIDAEMTLHDAAITRFTQWWKRTVRSGHALAERAALHGGSPLRDCVKQRRSVLFWGCAIPLFWLAGMTLSFVWPNLLLVGYLFLAWRIYRYRRNCDDPPRAARIYALGTVLGKFPQFQGLLIYYLNRWRGRRTSIIEYKNAGALGQHEGDLSRGCA